MSDEDAPGPRLSRRTVLAAVSTLGAAGALTGHGTAAYLTDRETLGSNGMTAGAVTLSLDGADADRRRLGFTLDGYGFGERDERTICIGLAAESNSGWVWLRACPGAPAVEDSLDARVTVDGAVAFSGTLGGLLETLSGGDGGGVLLTDFAGTGAVPLAPGTDAAVCLTIAVWAPASLADDPDAVRALKAAAPLSLTLDVYAEQSRHVPTPRRPTPGSNPSFAFPACEGSNDAPEEPSTPRTLAISNVSLCTAAPVDASAVTWTVRDPTTGADVTGVGGEAFVVDVAAPGPIDYAVVKAGPTFRRIDAGGATTVTVTSTNGVLLDGPKNRSRCACVGTGVKLDDWDDDAGTFTVVEAISCGGTVDATEATDAANSDGDETDGAADGGDGRDENGTGNASGAGNGNGTEKANGNGNANGASGPDESGGENGSPNGDER